MYIERDWKCILKGTGSVYLKGLEVYIERDWKCILKGTGSVYLKGLEVTLHAEMSMPEPQQYPCNLYLINIVGDIVVFSI